MTDSDHSQVPVAELRGLYRTTGALSDIHLFNLQLWPQLLFGPALADVEVRLDQEKHDIVFALKTKFMRWIPRSAKNLAKCRGLLESVQFMLGPDFAIEVLVDSKTIFRGERLEPVKAPEFQGVDFAAGKYVPKEPWSWKKKKP